MKKEELLDKYIKYNSKITFDIFKLIYQKLINLGFSNAHTVEDAFKEFSGNYPYFVMKLYTDGPNEYPFFNQYNCNLIEQSEISVEDLLGYNPFESFTLPEQWCIKVQEMENTPEEIVNWRVNTVMCGTWVSPGYLYNDGYHTPENDQKATEITLGQFKQYVLKKPLIPKPINPFPTQWCIELNKETIPIVGDYYNKKHLSEPNCDTYTEDGAIGYYVKSHNDKNEYIKYGYTVCSFFGEPSDSYPEITLEQFKEFVMNEPVKVESTIEYAECTAALHGLKVGQIYEVRDKRIGDYCYPAIGQFKPSTKEAFEEQNKPKSIEKWSVGSYIVPLQDRLLTRDEPLIKGKPYQIIEYSSIPYIICESGRKINFCDEDTPETTEGIKWFATKPEADEFSKTFTKVYPLVYNEAYETCQDGTDDDFIDKPKQLLKQAVHCKTQEEWDFVTDKLGYKWTLRRFDETSWISLNANEYSSENYWKKNGYQILSFQEWCDLKGYKMHSKCDFIVGRWYKSTAKANNRSGETYYGKFLSYDNGSFTATWHSVANNFTEQVYTFINGYKWELMTDLSEIQQYLPEDHPDKIPTYKFKVGDKVEIIHAGSGCSLEGDYPIEKAHNLLDIWGKDPIHIKPIKVKSLDSTQLLSLGDEELPMVSIIKTKTVSILSIN